MLGSPKSSTYLHPHLHLARGAARAARHVDIGRREGGHARQVVLVRRAIVHLDLDGVRLGVLVSHDVVRPVRLRGGSIELKLVATGRLGR